MDRTGAPRQRRKRHGSRDKDAPFIYLTFKVGLCILCIGWLATQTILFFSFSKSDSQQVSAIASSTATKKGEGVGRSAGKRDRFPYFPLDSHRLASDAFGIEATLRKYNKEKAGSSDDFHDEVSRLKKEFASKYGGENAARYLLHSGVTKYTTDDADTGVIDPHSMKNNIPSGLMHTAHRILSAKEQNRPFKIAFGGYSVTVGRGNYFHQSYPFVLKNLLTRPMDLLGIELQVRNAAIGGVPSFPYGWCLDNFLGDDVDVISWDYSMNEAGGVADGLEAYIRQGLAMKRRPMLILKDTSIRFAQKRYDLIQSYVDAGVLNDPIVLSIEDAIESFLQLKDELLPKGFQDWREFGAPKGSPGQTSHHPGVKQHELYGWLLTMHFVAALELVTFLVSNDKHDHFPINTFGNESHRGDKIMLPAPIYANDVAPSKLFSLFYGYDTAPEKNQMTWKMNPVYCSTTYDPILSNSLQDIITSGTLGEDLDIMLPRGAQMYNKGWVLDLGENEKKAKKKLERYGGLGYIDSKKAYYGIYASGQLQLFLPCIGREDISKKIQSSIGERIPAHECFRNVVVCEVNEKHTGQECDIKNDLSFLVRGIKSENVDLVNATGPSYWGRNICLRIDIPSESDLERNPVGRSTSDFDIGISISISVSSKSVMLRSGPCSISHIVWEQQ